MKKLLNWVKAHKKTSIAISVLVLFIVIGATNPSTNTSTSQTAATQSKPSTPAKTTNNQPVTNKAPSTTNTKPAAPQTPTLTGYGALLADWNAHHTPDTRYDANSVYNPDPSLGSDTEHDAKYYTVNTQAGRVLNYQMRLPNNGKQTTAQAEVMQEFPSDATVLWQKAQTADATSACYQMEVKSAVLGTALSDKAIGDATGVVFVEFSTDTPQTASANSVYDTANVNLAILQLGSYQTAADAPGC